MDRRGLSGREVTTVTLIGRDGCHLCETARELIEQVVAELPEDAAASIQLSERSIADDPALYELWWDKIPVVLIDNKLHAHWRVQSDRFRDALMAAAEEKK